jgi:hypothetical protein
MTISRNLSILAEGVNSSGVLAVTNGGTGVTTSTGSGNVVLSASPTLTGTLTVPTITSAAATALTIQSAGTTAITIDTSQNVGIGTSSPSYKLQVSGSSVVVRFESSNNNNVVAIAYNGTIGGFLGASGTNLVFSNNAGSEAMRITSGGTLLVGQTTAIGAKLEVGGFNSSAYVSSTGIGVAGNSHFLGGIRVDGTPSANQTSWTLISDARTKTVNGSFVDGLDAICALNPVQFVYNGKAGTTLDGVQRIGLIADDVQAVMPYCVGSREAYLDEGDAEKTEVLSLDTSPIVFALINAIKELSSKNDALEARLATIKDLSDKNNALTSVVNELLARMAILEQKGV